MDNSTIEFKGGNEVWEYLIKVGATGLVMDPPREPCNIFVPPVMEDPK